MRRTVIHHEMIPVTVFRLMIDGRKEADFETHAEALAYMMEGDPDECDWSIEELTEEVEREFEELAGTPSEFYD